MLCLKDIKNCNIDSFLRPPKWVVSVEIHNTMYYVLLSAIEANEYLEKKQYGNQLHILILRTNPNQKQNLFFPIIKFPPLTHYYSEFLIFSGSQYVANIREQNQYLQYLGLHIIPRSDKENSLFQKGIIDKDGFIPPSRRSEASLEMPEYIDSIFKKDPGELICQLCHLRNYSNSPDNSHYLMMLIQLKKPFE